MQPFHKVYETNFGIFCFFASKENVTPWFTRRRICISLEWNISWYTTHVAQPSPFLCNLPSSFVPPPPLSLPVVLTFFVKSYYKLIVSFVVSFIIVTITNHAHEYFLAASHSRFAIASPRVELGPFISFKSFRLAPVLLFSSPNELDLNRINEAHFLLAKHQPFSPPFGVWSKEEFGNNHQYHFR